MAAGREAVDDHLAPRLVRHAGIERHAVERLHARHEQRAIRLEFDVLSVAVAAADLDDTVRDAVAIIVR